jgi:hypothetical protein
MNLDQKLVKKSNVRLVVSGNKFERYTYERPYLYNLPPYPRSEGAKKKSERARRADNLACARRNIQRLISANINAWGERPKFVTFTFAKNVTDISSANEEWHKYMRKARQTFGQLKYLTVIEFQKRGAVHYHTVFFNMPYKRGLKHIIGRQWGQGFVKVIGLGRVNDIGIYVSKYMTEDTSDIRLCGRKAYFTSRGLVKPVMMRSDEWINAWTEENGHATVQSELTKSYVSDRFGIIKLETGIC